MTVTLDDSAKPHKSIDFKVDEGPEDAKGKTSKAIYKLDGDDKAVLCLRPEGERPDKFEQGRRGAVRHQFDAEGRRSNSSKRVVLIPARITVGPRRCRVCRRPFRCRPPGVQSGPSGIVVQGGR
jgi:hypothetical protein